MFRKLALGAAVAFLVLPVASISAQAQGYEPPSYEEPGYEEPRRNPPRRTYDEPRREPYGGCRFVIRPVDVGNGYKEDRRVLVCPD